MQNQFGNVSKLYLEAAYKDDKTIIRDLSFTAPFKVMHPFYEEKDIMTVMLLTASAGIMAGDRQELEIAVKEGAQMEFVSQAYEKIHKMKDGFAMRDTHIAVEKDAYLSYSPLPVIPFAESDFRSSLRVDLEDETSGFLFSEVLSCGRVAHGEKFAYKKFKNRISVYQGEKIVYLDNTCYEPDKMDMHGYGMYEGFTHLATLLLCNEPKTDKWFKQVSEMLKNSSDIEGGVTQTAAGHIVVRILGYSGQRLTDILQNIKKI